LKRKAFAELKKYSRKQLIVTTIRVNILTSTRGGKRHSVLPEKRNAVSFVIDENGF